MMVAHIVFGISIICLSVVCLDLLRRVEKLTEKWAILEDAVTHNYIDNRAEIGELEKELRVWQNRTERK